jgi:hypothetical protein
LRITIFLAFMTDDVRLEVALRSSYNRFMAEVGEKGQGTLQMGDDTTLQVVRHYLFGG